MKALVLLGPSGSGKSWIAAQLRALHPRPAAVAEIDPAGGAKRVLAAYLKSHGLLWLWEQDRAWRDTPFRELYGKTPREALAATARDAGEVGLSWLGYSLERAEIEGKALAIIGARRVSEALAAEQACSRNTVIWRLDLTHAALDAAWVGWWTERDTVLLEHAAGTYWGISYRKIPESRVIQPAAVLTMAREDGLL